MFRYAPAKPGKFPGVRHFGNDAPRINVAGAAAATGAIVFFHG